MTNLRALRESANLSQREAALLAGVNHRTLQLVETGRRRATPGLAAWLAWIYGRERRR